MSSNHPYGALAAWCVGVLLLVPALVAQEASAPGHVGVPQDWSDHNIVFSLDGLLQHPDLISQEPRIQHQMMQRFKGPEPNFFRGVDFGSDSATAPGHHRDWNVSFVRSHVAREMYPAKFSFDAGAPPDCTKDYVVFGLATAGIPGKQANLIAFNNLYSGTSPTGLCGTAPTVMFAYNITTVTGGRATLSPVISEDGTKIAFVESIGGNSIFHVLTWTAGQGSITNPAVPGTAMTSLTVAAANSTTSSPWVDYGTDTAYFGIDGGHVYKITGVFHGTPALAGGIWPITVSPGHHLTPPVLDNRKGLLMVGSDNGNLYQVDITTGAIGVLVVGALLKPSHSIVAPPIVDVTNGTTFVTSGDDGTHAVLVEVDTSSLFVYAKAFIGEGGSTGGVLSIQQPAFSNDYYNDPSTGVIRICGTGAADTTPWQYAFGFTGKIMNTTPVFQQQLVNSATAQCTGWTEFYNPNINAGTDFFFFGLTQNCVGAAGCVVERTTDIAPLVTVAIPGGPSGIVVDNYSNDPQASSIYFSAIGASTAYKLTQNGLQ